MNFLKAPRPAEICLIAANMVPLAGVLLWGWRVFDVMLLFWLENVIIGFFNILKMSAWIIRTKVYPAVVMVLFFTAHYGGFALAHFIVLMALFGGGQPGDTLGPAFILSRPEFHTAGFYGAALGLFTSHLFSFCANFLARGEIAKTHIGILMTAPYKRVTMLHAALLIGGTAAQILKQPVWALGLLIGLKIAFDLRAHHKSHAEKSTDSAENLENPAA